MKKIATIIILFSLASILSSCPPDEGTITYKKIKSAKALLFSFSENGIYPHLEDFNRNELGIGISFDSISERIEIAQSFSLMSKTYARSNPDEIIFLNSIESINVFTLYDFDSDHPAGSNVNDILLYLDDLGETFVLNINDLSSISHHFKFSVAPEKDTLQFEITGIITDEKDFIERTKLVILE